MMTYLATQKMTAVTSKNMARALNRTSDSCSRCRHLVYLAGKLGLSHGTCDTAVSSYLLGTEGLKRGGMSIFYLHQPRVVDEYGHLTLWVSCGICTRGACFLLGLALEDLSELAACASVLRSAAEFCIPVMNPA